MARLATVAPKGSRSLLGGEFLARLLKRLNKSVPAKAASIGAAAGAGQWLAKIHGLSVSRISRL
jgi:hypothetical protein